MNLKQTKQVPSQLPRLVVYLPPEIKTKFETLSERQRRSMSQMVVFLIEKAIKESERDESNSN